jgi:hypothetical protein
MDAELIETMTATPAIARLMTISRFPVQAPLAVPSKRGAMLLQRALLPVDSANAGRFRRPSRRGETTIARDLARTIDALHVRIDSIEQALRSAGWKVEGEGYSVAYAVAEDNLRLGHRVVADCVDTARFDVRESVRTILDSLLLR